MRSLVKVSYYFFFNWSISEGDKHHIVLFLLLVLIVSVCLDQDQIMPCNS